LGPALIEPIAARGWRASTCDQLGGWRLYASSGFSGRINTCWPLGDPGRPLVAAIAAVEAWYAARGLPARFKITEGCAHPAHIAEHLTALGYFPSVATLTMVGELPGAFRGEPDPDVNIAPYPGPGFRDVFAHGDFGEPEDAAERLGALDRIPAPRGYALISIDGAPAAIGACAVEGEWAGLMAMRTAPAHRRMGLARRVFRGLCAFGRQSGAVRGYLQVEDENVSAVRLYQSEGFESLYAYRYWQRP
jgi:ribosomal protein S18 acetylase RimI-like enzyme